MLQIAIIVFREILEISLIVGILTAATKDINGRNKWIIGGLALGIIASLILAFSTNKISDSLDGMGQEFFHGLIMLSTSAMISWTVLWMQKHAKSLSGDLKNLSKAVKKGQKPLYALLIAVFFTVLRESAEIVLFSYTSYISGTSTISILSGLAVGIILGTAVGVALYFGILKVFGRYFFSITSWILVFFAAGIAAQGIGFWINAGIVPAFQDPLFDSSQILSQQSFFGQFLNIFFGYMDQPTGSQFLTYVTMLVTLSFGLKIAKKI